MKTVIDHDGYSMDVSVGKKVIDRIKKKLTITSETDSVGFALYRIREGRIYVPRFFGVKYYKQATKIKFNPSTKIHCLFTASLHEEQKNVVDMCISSLRSDGGGVLSVPCGFGKTVCALNVFCSLRVKTMVVVHKSFLLEQWIERIITFTNLELGDIGIIRQSVCDTENKKIVIAMLPTLVKREGICKDKGFGLAIYDEAHHLGAKTYSQALLNLTCEYVLALTATPRRSDGEIRIMHWFVGNMIYRQENIEARKAIVKKIYYDTSDSTFVEKRRWYNGGIKPDAVGNTTMLSRNYKRNKLLIDIITYTIRKDPRRKMLVLSDRIEQLELLKSEVDGLILYDEKHGRIEKGSIVTRFYVGKTKEAERRNAEQYGDIIFASYQLASEGLDIKRLNTFVPGTPKQAVEQQIGRVMRESYENSGIKPLIFDICDMLPMFIRWADSRYRFYDKRDYPSCEHEAYDGFLLTRQSADYYEKTRKLVTDLVYNQKLLSHNISCVLSGKAESMIPLIMNKDHAFESLLSDT